jgi:hypothetical protein
MTTIEKSLAKMEVQLETWGSKLDKLVASAQKTGTKAKGDYRTQIAGLKAQQKSAQTKLNQLKRAGTSDWKTLKTGVESAWSDLESAFKKLTK